MVIVSVLILMIAVSLSALGYLFFSGVLKTTTETGTEAINRTVTGMLAQMRIESISINEVFIRNIGQTDLTGFSVYVNDAPVNFTAPPTIPKGGRDSIKIYGFIKEGDEIKITTAEGALATKKSPDPCRQTVLCLKFDDCTAKDSSPYGNDGTIYDTPVCVDGISGKGLNFDGVDDYVGVTESSSLQITQEITLEAWVSLDSLPDPATSPGGWHIISKDGAWGIRVRSNGDGFYFFLDTTNDGGSWNAVQAILGTLQLNRWYHVAGSYDGSSIRIYVDGELKGEISQSNAIDTGAPVKVGGGSAGYYLDGTIDEARVFDRAIY
jgi:hypothetical protein